MSTLCTYDAASGRRTLVFVAVPDEPGLRLLFDAAVDGQDGTDVVLVDDALTTLAEARIVAHGWASEHALEGTTVRTPTGAGDAPHQRRTSEPCELARYDTPAGVRRIVGQRIAGEVCVTDLPSGDDGTVHLVARGVASAAELDALVADYRSECERRGEPARRASAGLVDDLAGALA